MDGDDFEEDERVRRRVGEVDEGFSYFVLGS